MRTPHQRSQSGQGNFEYVGFVLLVVLVVIVLANSPAAPYLSDKFREAICRLSQIVGGGGNCSATAPGTLPNEAFEPDDPCLVFASEEAGDVSATVSFFNVGKGVILRKEVYADGSVDLTVLDEGSFSAEAGVEAEKEIGDVGKLGGNINVGGGVKLKLGGTYHFENKAAASELLNNIENYRDTYRWYKSAPLIGSALASGYRAAFKPDVPNEPTISRRELEGEVSADAAGGASLGPPVEESGTNQEDSARSANVGETPGAEEHSSSTPGARGVGASAELVSELVPQFEASVEGSLHGEAEASASLLNDLRDEATTHIYRMSYRGTAEVSGQYILGLTGRARAKGQISAAPLNMKAVRKAEKRLTLEGEKKAEIDIGREGALSVRRDEHDRLVGLQLVHTARDDKWLSAVTTNLEIRNQKQRHIVNHWLNDSHPFFRAAETTIRDPGASIQDGPGSTVFDRLLYHNAEVSRVTYAEKARSESSDVGVEVGQKAAVGNTLVTTNRRATSAQYLGAPRDGIRHYIQFPECRR